MSTVHEALTAHHCGIEVVAFSLITNICILERERYYEYFNLLVTFVLHS